MMKIRLGKIKIMILLLFVISLNSCRKDLEQIVIYSYDGQFISRYDDDRVVYFYYGRAKYVDQIKENASVIVDWGAKNYECLCCTIKFEKKMVYISGGIFDLVKNSPNKIHVNNSDENLYHDPMDDFRLHEIKDPYYYLTLLDIEEKSPFNQKSKVKREVLTVKHSL